MTNIVGKDVDVESIPGHISGYKEYVKSFSESANEAREIIVPNGVRAWAMYGSLMRHIRAMGLQDKVKVRVVKCKSVYIYKVLPNSHMT